MIYYGVIALCENTTAITDLIGTNPMRMYPVLLPQGLDTYPAVKIKTLDTVPTDDFDEASDFDFTPVDFHCFAETLKEAQNLAITIRDELNGASGTYNGVQINDVRFAPSGTDDYLEDLELYTYHIELQFNIRR